MTATLAGALAASRTGPATGSLRSVGIATNVLDCFLEHAELGPTRVARELGVAKSTAYGMLGALHTAGLLERTARGRYRLSLRMFHYGLLAMDRLPVRALAGPVLVELHDSLNMVVQLGLPVDGHVLYVERIGNLYLGPRVGGGGMRRVPGYASSAGRAMAAFDPTIASATATVPRLRRTPFTVTDPARLQRILHATRTSGWVSSHDESALGLSSVAAPVFAPPAATGPRVAAAISAVAPTAVVVGRRREFVVASIRRAARRITDLLAQAEDLGPATEVLP